MRMLGMNLDTMLPMLAKMAGVTPDMLQNYMRQMATTVMQYETRLCAMEEKLNRIMAAVETPQAFPAVIVERVNHDESKG